MTAGGQTHLVLDHQDVRFFEVDADGRHRAKDGRPTPGTFSHLRWNPTYGGIGSPAPRELEYYVDHVYISGR
jgi:hypothetical protein